VRNYLGSTLTVGKGTGGGDELLESGSRAPPRSVTKPAAAYAGRMATPVEALVAERSHLCRLTLDRALASFDDAVAFLADRRVLTRTPDCSLPSLFEACHEDPYRAGGHGFAAWPKTKYWWAGELEQRPDVLVLKVHRGKNIMFTGSAIETVAVICLDELERMEHADAGWRRVLRHLESAGPSTLEDLQRELDLKPKELRSLRSPLERCGAVVARQRVLPVDSATDFEATADAAGTAGHIHTSELARVDQVWTMPTSTRNPQESFEDLIVEGLRAAVVATESELSRWFSWRWRYDVALVDRLVEQGRARRHEGGLVTSREP
jgi:hypothetical protein